MYESVSLMFFSSTLPFPDNDLAFGLLWIAYPLIGLFGLAEGLTSVGRILRLGNVLSPEWNRAVIEMMEDHIIIVGLGNVGLRVLEQIKTQTDWDVVCIDKHDGPEEDLIEEYQKRYRVPVISGRAERELTLRKAGITKAKVIMSLIDDDLLNLKIALLAQELNPNIYTIVRMFDVEFGELVQSKFNIGEIVSTTKVAAPVFLKAVEENVRLN